MQSRWEGKQPCLTSQPGNYEFLTKLVSNYLNNTLQLELFLTTLWPLIGIECKEYGAPEQPEYEEPSSDYGAPSAEPINSGYGSPASAEPIDSGYGAPVPTRGTASSYSAPKPQNNYNNNQLTSPKKVNTGGWIPIKTGASSKSSKAAGSGYGAPANNIQAEDTYSAPARDSYGAPAAPAEPATSYGAPRAPPQEYGAPQAPVISYGAPKAPSLEYGAPLAPAVGPASYNSGSKLPPPPPPPASYRNRSKRNRFTFGYRG